MPTTGTPTLEGMNRRALGALVLGFALIAAVAVPGSVGRQVSGSPAAEPIDGPPTVGQCVLRTAGRTPASASGFTEEVLSYGGCAGPHYGEVVRVLDRGLELAASSWLPTSVGSACRDAANEYVGLDPSGRFEPDTVDSWFPAFHDGATAGVPTAHQRAAGQGWLACAVIPRTTTATGNGYPGLVRGALRTGRLPDGFGRCSDDPIGELPDTVSCDRPHRYQVAGETTTTTSSSAVDLKASCATLLHTMTRMPDLTAGGQLEVVVTFTTWTSTAGPIVASHPLAVFGPQSALCSLHTVGTARLTGSLLGLGNASAPLEG